MSELKDALLGATVISIGSYINSIDEIFLRLPDGNIAVVSAGYKIPMFVEFRPEKAPEDYLREEEMEWTEVVALIVMCVFTLVFTLVMVNGWPWKTP